jgi:glycosyltransferase involved in cell wall biosynthesis
VVIPTHGRRALLGRAVRSVFAQDHGGPIECLVVFDRTPAEAIDVEIPRGSTLRTVENDRTAGPAGARNAGALAATGEYLAFLDDDDEWMPSKIRVQLAAIGERPDAIGAVSGLRIRRGDRVTDRGIDRDVIRLADLLRSRRIETSFCALLLRREDFVERVGLIDETIPASFGEDYDWMLRAAAKGPILCVRRPLVTVHWHGGSFFDERWETMAGALTALLEKHPEFEREPRGLARVVGQIAFARAAHGDRRRARRDARRALRLNPLEPRAYLAYATSLGIVPARQVLRVAHYFGRGI